MTPATRVASVLAAVVVAIPVVSKWEGLRLVGYRDPHPAGFATTCYGNRSAAVVGKRYTEEECAKLLAEDATRHGLAISKCLPDDLPVKTRAAFTAFAFNIGEQAFCSSTLSKKARAGDLVGACAELARWVTAGGKTLPGLVARRAEEQALCLEGVASLRPAVSPT